ncbi:unnamed protein product [Brassicogethes aeneus]|uniref:DNA polymerase subunit gamma-1 n=1 Tax=Brassicogethes aeneus TaxID=1431903 RepID=A0A9P0BEB5_BRAAE|nr:unnamed protein product [Brassicogethes aeneus]
MLILGKMYKTRYFKFKNVIHRKVYTRDTLPSSTKKIYKPNPDKIAPKRKNMEGRFEKTVTGFRRNKLGIQMLSRALYDQIFPEGDNTKVNSDVIEKCIKTLEEQNMISKEDDFLQDVDIKLPKLQGKNIEEHFYNIAKEQAEPYLKLVGGLIGEIPLKPKLWVLQSGWTQYKDGEIPIKVPYPPEEALVFDVEVCMAAGKAPTLATAVSNSAWYAWVSPTLVEGTHKPVTSHSYTENILINLESTEKDSGLKISSHMAKPKVVVGHNVSYDRAKIREQYWLKSTGTKFVDTMSLHVCIGGLTSYQRAVIKSDKFNDEDDSWRSYSSLNSLVEVYKLFCGESLEKETRNLFVEGTISEIKDNFQLVMAYCANDVTATHKVLQKMFPLFRERFPHPATFSGMLEIGGAYLPVNGNWSRYVADSEQAYEDLEIEGKVILARRADQACQLSHDNMYECDLWMWDQDWDVKNIKTKKVPAKKKKQEEPPQAPTASTSEEEEPDPLREKFAPLWNTKEYLSSVKTLLPGYPNWYRKLCTKPSSGKDWVPGPHLISTSMQITPKLLNLTWEGYPLHHLREKGWGFLVPFTDDLNVTDRLPLKQLIEKCPLLSNKDGGTLDFNSQTLHSQVERHLGQKDFYSRVKKDKTQGLYKGSGVFCNTEVEDCCYFMKLPHKDGASYNVGNPLAKDFLNKFSENVLAGDTESAEKVLTIARMLSYWRNNRDRIMEQMVVWLERRGLPKNMQENSYGAILPQVVVCGTLTRRASEPTWMTASNAHRDRIGSELRAMVQAPPGYNIVGADVDSQELWIASVLGDARHARLHGATPLGWMTLSGTKSRATDMHSVTAKAVGISRDHAKVINYARIYGAGQNFAERLLKQFNPTLTQAEARSKATKMFNLTKGKRIYFIKQDYRLDFADIPYGKWQAFEIAKACGKSLSEMFHESKWVGGTESAMFNCLEEIANQDSPRTPFLNCRLSRALEPKNNGDDRFLPTRVNWVVQSGAVDFLHLMLVCMKWLMEDKVRFCLSFHDEVRYLVPEQHKYMAALSMHVTNLLTRSFCSYKLGLNDLPQSVAFFSSVEVDTVLRKESKQDCVTPSNPHGLTMGYNVPNGESLDIHQAIEKAKQENFLLYKK